jgi:hypothetical protein
VESTDKCLTEIVGDYLRRAMRLKSGLMYFGVLVATSPDQGEEEIAILLKVEGRHNGFVTKGPGDQYSASYFSDAERLVFRFTSSGANISVEPYSITRREHVIREAVFKEDWMTPSSLEISVQGDFSEQVMRVNEAVARFREVGRAELLLPAFINYP